MPPSLRLVGVGAIALALACDAPVGPRPTSVTHMQVSASLSADTISLDSAHLATVEIRVRNPLPYTVTLGPPEDYPWWMVLIEPVGEPYAGVASFTNPFGSITLESGADTTAVIALDVWRAPHNLPAGDYQVRAGLEPRLSKQMLLHVRPWRAQVPNDAWY